MTASRQTLSIQPEAPSKPAPGAPCNGCGLCCLAEPCPLGIVLSVRRRGACDALRWHCETRVYRCGAISQPAEVLKAALPRPLRGLAFVLLPLLGRMAKRWIAAGRGCDSSLQVDVPGAK